MTPVPMKIVLVADVKDAPFKCFSCHKVFISNRYLKKHIEKRHSANSFEQSASCPSHFLKEIDSPIVENPYLNGEASRIEEEILREEHAVIDFKQAWARERQWWLIKLEKRLAMFRTESRGISDSQLRTILTEKKIQDLYNSRFDEAGRAWRQELREILSHSVDSKVQSRLSGTLTSEPAVINIF